MTAVKHSLSWLFLVVAVTSMAIQWAWGLETSTAVWWVLAILLSGEAAFVSGNERTRFVVGFFAIVALTGLLTDTPGLLTPLGQGVIRLIAVVVLIHLMIMFGYGRKEARPSRT